MEKWERSVEAEKNLKSELERKEKEIEKLKKEVEELKNEVFKRERLIERLKEDLIHDDLTGLYTRKFFREFLKKELEKREGETGSLLFGDIDDFKRINDQHGHQKGDEVLKEVGKILRESTRSEDVVARWGGEEFIIFLRRAKEEYAILKAKFLKEKVKRILTEKFGFPVSLSFGVKEIKEGEGLDELIYTVDTLMYESKKKGKDTVTAFSEIQCKEKKSS